MVKKLVQKPKLLLDPYLDMIIESGEVHRLVDLLVEGEDKNDKYDFKPKEELNPHIWDGQKVRPEIRNHLINIAKAFFDEDKDKATLTDIAITGSIANYNWSKFSDVDLHVVVDLGRNHELKRRMFALKATLWNEHHNITIMGHEVEIYVQDINEPHYSTGVYSLQNNKWIKKPTKFAEEIDLRAVRKKALRSIIAFRHIKHLVAKRQFIAALEAAQKLAKRLRKARKAGLERGGEMSIENLTYKYLRRRGVVEGLVDIKRKAYDAVQLLGGVRA